MCVMVRWSHECEGVTKVHVMTTVIMPSELLLNTVFVGVHEIRIKIKRIRCPSVTKTT